MSARDDVDRRRSPPGTRSAAPAPCSVPGGNAADFVPAVGAGRGAEAGALDRDRGVGQRRSRAVGRPCPGGCPTCAASGVASTSESEQTGEEPDRAFVHGASGGGQERSPRGKQCGTSRLQGNVRLRASVGRGATIFVAARTSSAGTPPPLTTGWLLCTLAGTVPPAPPRPLAAPSHAPGQSSLERRRPMATGIRQRTDRADRSSPGWRSPSRPRSPRPRPAPSRAR